jgi:hypothetical protein
MRAKPFYPGDAARRLGLSYTCNDSPPSPSRTQSKVKMESITVRKGIHTGGGCAPSLPKPLSVAVAKNAS